MPAAEPQQTGAGAPTGQQQSQQPGQPQQGTTGGASETSPQQPGLDGIQNPEAKRYAEEAAKYRRDLRDTEQKLAEVTRTAQERVVRAEIKAQAPAFGIKPELAMKLLNPSEITFDGNGDPENFDKLLAKLAKDYLEPGNASSASQQSSNGQQPHVPNVPNPGATSPERQNGALSVTANQYLDAAFRKEFRERYGMDLETAALKGRVTIV